MGHFAFINTLERIAVHKYGMALSEEGYNLYNAVYTVAHTYHELILQQVQHKYYTNTDTSRIQRNIY